MYRIGRRDFFKQAAGAIGTATQIPHWAPFAEAQSAEHHPHQAAERISFPRVFSGDQLKMLAFPLGGVAAGSLALGGRGQLRDWEIFNRPNKGFSPPYAFPSIWIKAGNAEPVTRVLEARILPPYEGQDGLGSNNSPGLSRIATAEFTAQYPLAHLHFKDPSLPVRIELEAFSPFIPHDPDASGLPVAILRYRVSNPATTSASVAISFSIHNPVKPPSAIDVAHASRGPPVNQCRKFNQMEGSPDDLPQPARSGDPMQGIFACSRFQPEEDRPRIGVAGHGAVGGTRHVVLGCLSRDGELLNEPAARNSLADLPTEVHGCRRLRYFHFLAGLALSTHRGVVWTGFPRGRRPDHHRHYYATWFKMRGGWPNTRRRTWARWKAHAHFRGRIHCQLACGGQRGGER